MPSANRPNLSIAIPKPNGEFQRPVRGPIQGTAAPSQSTRTPTLPRDPFVVEDSMEDIPLEELGPPPPYSNFRRAAPPARPHESQKSGLESQKQKALRPWSAWRKASFVTSVLLGVGTVVAISVYEAHKSGTQVK